MKKIIKYVILDILRNKIIVGYTLFLLVVSASVFNLENNSAKGLLSLLHIVLIIVPLISIIFSAIYYYNSAEFIELLVSQPIRRVHLMMSMYCGLALSLMIAFFVGCGIPILIFNASPTGFALIIGGMLLSAIFVAVALLASVHTRDKAKGIGVAILLWFYFSIIYDGLILFILFQFSDYPMEKPMIAFSSLNPIDLTRIFILLRMDESALMGYTGAIFREFLGSTTGVIYAGLILMAWILLPSWLAIRKFNRKDL